MVSSFQISFYTWLTLKKNPFKETTGLTTNNKT